MSGEGHAVTLLEKHHIAAMASGWTLGGVRQSGRDKAELPLAKAAIALWRDLPDILGQDVQYRRHGNLRLARNDAEVVLIRTLVQRQRAQGLAIEFLSDNAAVKAVAPALSDHVRAASYCATDGHANPLKTMQAFAAAARRQGVTLKEGVRAEAIRVNAGRVTGVETNNGFIAAAGLSSQPASIVRPFSLRWD